ncbi:hypothetical protein KKD80_03920 [Patescibacteria group bacterium]|nr:hypothetical protein [Patescibacteria group bacterium]
MKRKSLFKKIVGGTLVSLILMLAFPSVPAHATHTSIKDTMSRLKTGVGSNHEIQFTLDASTNIIEDETIIITFAASWTDGLNSIDCEDIDIMDDATQEDIAEVAVEACAATATEWGAIVAGDVLTLTAPSGASTYIDASSVVTIKIGTNATEEHTGDTQIVNPAAGNDLAITIGGTGDSGTDPDGQLAVSIIAEDQVTVTATVLPSFTFTISSSTCALGDLTLGTVQTCNVTLTTTTNAVSGYTTTVVGTAAGAEMVHSNLTDDIDNATGVEVNANSEEFGIGTSDSGVDIVQESDCAGADGGAAADAESIDTNGDNVAASVASAAGPVAADATIACFAASAAATTVAGQYTSTVTFISTGTF